MYVHYCICTCIIVYVTAMSRMLKGKTYLSAGVHSQTEPAGATGQQQPMLRRKKKKTKRINTSTTGIFVRRGVSSPRPIHCLDSN